MRQKDLCDFSLKEIRIHPRLQIRVAFGTAGWISVCHVQHFQHDYPVRAQQIRNRHGAAWAAYGKLDAIVWMVSGASVLPSQLSSVRTTVPESMTASEKVSACIGMDFAAAILLMLVLVCFRIPLFHIFVTDENVVEIGLK